MKHRSVVAFILLAATLAAVPQAGQDLSELKSALGARVRSEIWSVFLSLNGRGGAVQTAPRSARHTLASCPNSPSNVGSKRSGAPARAAAQAGASAQTDAARPSEDAELAMMLTPPAGPVEEKIEVETLEELKHLGLGKVLKAPTREPLPAREMAMIIPPNEAPDAVVPNRLSAVRAADIRARARRAELESRATYVATAFNERGVEFRKAGDVLRFQFSNPPKDGVEIHLPAPAPKAKVTKVKRPQATTNVTAPVAFSNGQAKHLACLVSELGQVSAPEAATE